MKEPNILITGGCGFIGANLVAHLRQDGARARIRILDDFSVGSPDRLRGFEGVDILQGDVRDAQACLEACEGIDAVVHLAASSGIAPSLNDPRKDFEINVVGTFHLLEAARRQGVSRFLLASSGAALGDVDPPFHEAQVARPISPYGSGKLAAEAYGLSYASSFGLGTVLFRFSNVYGPRSEHKKSVVSSFFKRALKGEPLVIYGDGNQSRDLIYVGDLCRAILLGIRSDLKGEIFQIATNRETTVSELACSIQSLVQADSGKKVDVLHEPARKGDVKRNYSNTEKARRLLGFSHAVDLQEGLRLTYDSFKILPRA